MSKLPERLEVKEAYVICVRCKVELFLGNYADEVDAIRCHVCGTTNLLGDIDKVRRARVMRVASRRLNA